MQTKSFEGKIAAITGAGSGIGRALARALSARGATLALSDVDEAGLAQTAEGLPRVTTKRVDVSKRDEVIAWARDVGAVNLVFNNAGIAYSATVAGAEYDDFHRVMDIDFWGVVHGTRAFLPALLESGDGHVVNVSSLFGLIGFPAQCTYNAAKFAVRGFTESLQIELAMTGAKVHATCVHPGGIKTNIARAAKTHDSIAALGVDPQTATSDFERNFRVTAEEAAEVILRGVLANKRRVLIGADAALLDFAQRLAPGAYHGLIARFALREIRRSKRK